MPTKFMDSGNPSTSMTLLHTVNREIFVIWNFHWKNWVDVLWKHFNTKILQHRSRKERTERVTAMEVFFERNCIHGYHVYKKVWAATVEEALMCKKEPKNYSDRYTVAVKNEGTIIEHLPQKLSRVCSLFLWRGSTQSQGWASSASTWTGAEYNTHRNYSL